MSIKKSIDEAVKGRTLTQRINETGIRKDSYDREAIERFIELNDIYFKNLAQDYPFSTVEDYVLAQIDWYNTASDEDDEALREMREGMNGMEIYSSDSRKIADIICNRWKTVGWQYDSYAEKVAKQRAKNRIGKQDGLVQIKQDLLGKIDDLYHAYFVVEDALSQAQSGSPIKTKCEDVYNAITELNKAITEAYDRV